LQSRKQKFFGETGFDLVPLLIYSGRFFNRAEASRADVGSDFETSSQDAPAYSAPLAYPVQPTLPVDAANARRLPDP